MATLPAKQPRLEPLWQIYAKKFTKKLHFVVTVFIENDNFQHIIYIFDVESENLVPLRREGFVFGLGLKTGVSQLQDAKRVAFAADIGGRQSRSFEDFNSEMAHVFEIVKSAMPDLKQIKRAVLRH